MVSGKIVYMFSLNDWEIMTSQVCGLLGPQGHGREDL